ncbi:MULTISPECIES: hypothetical protein [Spirulina sp. CCY15215]|uniref:hypothetical protein n=1 Tax=Spirulina sp. CCY15215 TaxID=2767591 RepID=UPI001950052A|nr:hypothetical protein [Spirulina major]
MKKLRQKSTILMGLVLLSLSVGGCEALSFLPFVGGGSEDTGDIPVAPATIPAGTIPGNPEGTNVPTGENAGQPGFEDPVIKGEKTELPTPDGLIPVTSRDAAVKIIQQNQGRQNPFATIPLQISNSVNSVLKATAQQNTGGQGVAKLPTPSLPPIPRTPTLPRAKQRPAPFVRPQVPKSVAPQAPSNVRPQAPSNVRPQVPKSVAPQVPKSVAPQAPSNVPPQAPSNVPPLEWAGPGEKPEPLPEFNPDDLPKLPEPTIAKGLTVTGVVNLGGSTKAIVQDSEGKSQYVSPGEYLESGQVLVKRIEMNRGPQPVVIFEELGIEVIRAVGAPPADNNA